MVRVRGDGVLLCPGLGLGGPGASRPAGGGTSGGVAGGCPEDGGGIGKEAGSGGEGAMGWC